MYKLLNQLMAVKKLQIEHLTSLKWPHDFLFYDGVRSAIPSKWLQKIHKVNSATLGLKKPNNLYSISNVKETSNDIRQATCSQLYWVEIDEVTERPTCYNK